MATSTVVGAAIGAAVGLLILIVLIVLAVRALSGARSGTYVVNEDLNPELIVYDQLADDMENDFSVCFKGAASDLNRAKRKRNGERERWALGTERKGRLAMALLP
jgi:hypothetical protein